MGRKKLPPEQKKDMKEYYKTQCVQFKFLFNYRADEDIIEKLSSVEGSKIGYIRGLIRKDIAENR